MITGSTMATLGNLDGPGRYLHWSIFTVSEANLVLIAVMVVIFGAALIIPFPGHARGPRSPGPGDALDDPATATGSRVGPSDADTGDDADAAMWTSRLRRRALHLLPPGKLLPDRQPAYVASWVYVFGVATLGALALAIVSGFVIALGGTDWWHTDSVGHFFNSLHLWSVEAFMAFMVIHLWGKFWMAAWRGRRALTWVTGVVAFVASVVECFTGYLSQQNFDSQWISTSGKDAFDAVGVGAFFNLMNVGQMLLWHVVLIPVILVAIVGAHVLAVRVRGVVHPLPVARSRGRSARRAAAVADGADWQGPTRRYDIAKEATIALAVSLVLIVALAGFLSSPDIPPVTVASWAQVAPADFVATAATELAGTSETATYGPPYNNAPGNTQSLLFAPANISGVRQPVDAAQTFVLSPLSKVAPVDPTLAAALDRYRSAPASAQAAWTAAYLKAVTHITFRHGAPVVPAAADGPVPAMLATEFTLARSGALDSDLVSSRTFYGTNFTKPLLFLEDGQYFSDTATAQHLQGAQWGVMNETGSYPGQPWLWLYTLWYQVRPFDNSTNVDLMAIYLTGAATILLLAIPFIPGLRDIPRLVPVHRLIWRDWNGRGDRSGGPPAVPDEATTTSEPSTTPARQ
ncbi:MAG TPA: cytochrome b N-terminal domain-containing protein [Acidimicrobiales bacterium]|nr:cytochrome b N-terminal domain-containing protein [Acidimicrobiales bacterium]